jgi:predicted amidohydrolase
MTQKLSNPKQRTIRIGAASLVVTAKDKLAKNCYPRLLDFCEKYLPGCGCQVVLLPEMYEYQPGDVQSIQGPIAKAYGHIAKQNNLWLIAPLSEKGPGKPFNSVVVVAPSGKVVHVQRKVHLAPGENKGHTAGTAFKTFSLPFGDAGIMTCFDNQFPESSRCLAVQGARIIFFPSYGDLAKPHRNAARCLDNHVWLVHASMLDASCNISLRRFDQGSIRSPDGKVLAATGARTGLAILDIKLDKNGKLEPWTSKDSIGYSESYLNLRRPETYSILCRPNKKAKA